MNSLQKLVAITFFGLAFSISSWAMGQGGQGGGDLGGQDGGNDQVPQQQVPDTTNQDTGDDGTTVTGGDGVIDTETDQVDISISDNTRNQGFVGSTSASIQNPDVGFVGGVSNDSGPPLADGQSFGGGINSGLQPSQFQAQQPNAQRNQTTLIQVEVIRRSIRAKLRTSFYAPRPSGQQMSTRFNNRFVRQPGSQTVGTGYSVRVENRKATLTGMVSTAADSARLVRQLRLEPGVYKIDNQLQIANPNQ